MIYFTSDHHFDHNNVIKYCDRPYVSVQEMNEMLIKNWNDTVKPEDEVYYLGDFSLSFKPVLEVTHRLNGKKYLVPGNHDFCHTSHKKGRSPEKLAKQIKAYEDAGWIVLPQETTLDIPGVATVNLCHVPYHTVNWDGADKYKSIRPKDDGKWLLCGHVHQIWKVVGRMINVGVDVWDMKPVSIEEISKIICTSSII